MYRDRGGVEQDGVEQRGQDGLNNRLCVFEKRLRLRFEQKPESDGNGLTSLFLDRQNMRRQTAGLTFEKLAQRELDDLLQQCVFEVAFMSRLQIQASKAILSKGVICK